MAHPSVLAKIIEETTQDTRQPMWRKTRNGQYKKAYYNYNVPTYAMHYWVSKSKTSVNEQTVCAAHK